MSELRTFPEFCWLCCFDQDQACRKCEGGCTEVGLAVGGYWFQGASSRRRSSRFLWCLGTFWFLSTRWGSGFGRITYGLQAFIWRIPMILYLYRLRAFAPEFCWLRLVTMAMLPVPMIMMPGISKTLSSCIRRFESNEINPFQRLCDQHCGWGRSAGIEWAMSCNERAMSGQWVGNRRAIAAAKFSS